jgi:hypothetical protein
MQEAQEAWWWWCPWNGAYSSIEVSSCLAPFPVWPSSRLRLPANNCYGSILNKRCDARRFGLDFSVSSLTRRRRLTWHLTMPAHCLSNRSELVGGRSRRPCPSSPQIGAIVSRLSLRYSTLTNLCCKIRPVQARALWHARNYSHDPYIGVMNKSRLKTEL